MHAGTTTTKKYIVSVKKKKGNCTKIRKLVKKKLKRTGKGAKALQAS